MTSAALLHLLFSHLLSIVGLAMGAVLIANVLVQRRTPQSTFAWLLAIVLIPYVGVPLYVVAPSSTVDLATPDGSAIPIEERDGAEVTTRFRARTPAFDVTPS